MLPAIVTVMLSWLLVFSLTVGLGQLVRSRFGLSLDSVEAWMTASWLGYAVGIAGLQVWHLLWPLDWRVCLAAAVVGTVWYGWQLWHVDWRQVRVSRWGIGRALLTLLVFVPMAVWIAHGALDAQLDFDSGLYHLSLVHWLNAYPVVPGLGNLHYRLAFNQTFFLFVAALNVYPLFNEGLHIANSFLLIVLAFQLTSTLIGSLFRPRDISLYHVLSALFLPVVMYRAYPEPFSANLPSPSPDLSVFVFQIVVILALVKFLWATKTLSPQVLQNEQRFSLFFCISLSLLGITSKLSFAGFGLSIILLILICWLRQHRRHFVIALRSSGLWLIITGGFLVLPWMAQGILTSGYPAFPSTFGALPVDFRVPTAITTDAADWVFIFARDPHGNSAETLQAWDWLPSWASRMRGFFNQFLFVIPAVVAGIALVIYGLSLALLRLIRWSRPPDHRLWLPLLPALLSTLFWFFTAPDPRFAGAAFWIVALWNCILVLNLLKGIRLPVLAVRLGIVTPLALTVTIVVFGLMIGFDWAENGFPPLRQAPMNAYQTDSGLIVNIPANPDNPLQLWDAPLPASPYSLPDLELRGADLSTGFRMRTP